MIWLKAQERGCDDWGCGNYGASRGSRIHKGIDFKAEPDQDVLASVSGQVTKLGYPYADDLSYRYVQITDSEGNDIRYFYVEPTVELGDLVSKGDMIGLVQNVSKRYPKMTNHVHIEIKKKGVHIDPNNYFV